MLVSHEARLKAEDVRKGGEGGGREGYERRKVWNKCEKRWSFF